MKSFNITTKQNNEIESDNLNIIIEYKNSDEIDDLIKYLQDYEIQKNTIIAKDQNNLIQINCNDIVAFVSNKKENFCRTKNKTYKVKSKLYEIETMYNGFIRISKCCIINIYHVLEFDIGTVGKVIVKLDDGTCESVSRRKIHSVMKYLDERCI